MHLSGIIRLHTVVKRWWVAFYCFFLMSAISATDPINQTFTVRMVGVAQGTSLSARKLAIETAQQRIIEEILHSLVGSREITPLKPIVSQASRYIQHYDVLRSEIRGNGTEVEIDAVVLEKPLRHDVATIMLPLLPTKPSVRIILAEYVGSVSEQAGPTFDVAESVLRKSLVNFDFPTVGVQDLLDTFEIQDLLRIIGGNVAEVAAFVRSVEEDVVITGTVKTSHEPITPYSNMQRNKARVDLRIFSGGDGKLHETLTAEAVVQSVHSDDGGVMAVQDACGKVTADCIVGVVLATLGATSDNRVIIYVSHPATKERVEQVVAHIKAIPLVSDIETLFFSEAFAKLAIDYTGSMSYLSDMLTGALAGGKKVDVTYCVGRKIKLRFL